MKKKTRNVSLTVLTLAAVVSLTACTGARVAKKDEEKVLVPESSYVEKSNETVVDTPVVEEAPSSSNSIVDTIMAMEDTNPLKIALNRILNSNQDTETCLQELEYIYELGMIPRCASDEEWALISHLDATTEEMENPFEVYYELAVYVHQLTCDEEHYVNEFGQMECKTLREELESGIGFGK